MRLVPVPHILLVAFGIPIFTLNASARPQQRFAASDTTALVRGTVSGYAGMPLAGVRVVAIAKVFKMNPGREILGADSTLTSDSGTYVLPALDLNSPGLIGEGTAYYLTFSKAGYRSRNSDNLDFKPLNPGDSITYDMRLAKILDLTIMVGKAETPDSAPAGASLVLGPIPASSPIPFPPGTAYRYGSLNASGMYTFADIDSGAKSITVALDGYKPALVRKAVSEGAFQDSVRILLERSNPDSMRTLIVKVQNPMPSAAKDSMVFSADPDSLPMNLLAISDSGVFTFRNIPNSYTSGLLTTRYDSDTAALTGPVTQKKYWLHTGILSISPSQGPASETGKSREIPGPVPYYFDGKSGKSFNILGRPRPAFVVPATKP